MYKHFGVQGKFHRQEEMDLYNKAWIGGMHRYEDDDETWQRERMEYEKRLEKKASAASAAKLKPKRKTSTALSAQASMPPTRVPPAPPLQITLQDKALSIPSREEMRLLDLQNLGKSILNRSTSVTTAPALD